MGDQDENWTMYPELLSTSLNQKYLILRMDIFQHLEKLLVI